MESEDSSESDESAAPVFPESSFLNRNEIGERQSRSSSRFVPPTTPLTPERREQILAQHKRVSIKPGKQGSRASQGQLPLEIVPKGRFDKSEPTIYEGEDLDIPTYIRRGVSLN